MKTLLASTLPVLLALFPARFVGVQSGAPTVVPDPQKLVIEMEVPARVAEVWKAFSTSEGLSTWLAPNCVVELRAGGEWTVHFPGGSTGGGNIVSFEAEKQMVISALAPDQFPHVWAERTRARFEFEPHGDSTVVRLTQTGWKSGPEWTHAYEYLLAGNAQLMAALHRRFAEGPTDWTKAMVDSGMEAGKEAGQ